MPILQIRDADGNFIPINAIKGDKGNDGKSAYEQAKEGGYTGTEEDFIGFLNGSTDVQDTEHRSNFNNPHNVTKAQLGLANVTAGLGGSIGLDASSTSGGAVGEGAKEISGGGAVGQAAYTTMGGAVGVGATATKGGAVGSSTVSGNGFAGGNFARAMRATGEGIDAIQLGMGTNPNEKTLQIYDYPLLDAKGVIPSDRLPIYRGSYQGAGAYGTNAPNTITFPVKPNAVVISHPSSIKINTTDYYCVTLPMVYGCSMGFISLSSSDREAPYNVPLMLTWEGNTLSWYYPKTDSKGACYQLNYSGETYEYFAW